MTTPLKIAYCGNPHDNGVFTFYRALRGGLAGAAQVYCVSLGQDQRAHWDARFVDDGCVNLGLGPDGLEQSRGFAAWCEREGIHIVMPQHVPAVLAALPHLPPALKIVHACMDTFPEALAMYQEIALLTDRVVAATPRQFWELTQRGVPEARLAVIPFAYSEATFPFRPVSELTRERLEIVWVARVHHVQKGVCWVPEILSGLRRAGVPFRFQVVGEGHHRPWLERQLRAKFAPAEFVLHGRRAPDEVAAILREGHVYLLPTRYEGMPISVIEAMACGCLPVATRLRGITDWMMRDGVDGVLCELGRPEQFAAALARLWAVPAQLQAMRQATQATARSRFSNAALVAAYSKLFQEVRAAPSARAAPRPWEQYAPRATTYRRQWWRRLVPGRLSLRLRDWRERALCRRALPGWKNF